MIEDAKKEIGKGFYKNIVLIVIEHKTIPNYCFSSHSKFGKKMRPEIVRSCTGLA